MPLGNNIKHLRKLLNLRQIDIGSVAGVAHNTIGRYETGERLPSSVEISAMATYFGVTLEMLIGQDLVAKFPDLASYEAYKAEREAQQRRGEAALDAVRLAPYRLRALVEHYADTLEQATGKPAAETIKEIEARARRLAAAAQQAPGGTTK